MSLKIKTLCLCLDFWDHDEPSGVGRGAAGSAAIRALPVSSRFRTSCSMNLPVRFSSARHSGPTASLTPPDLSHGF